MIGVPVRAVTDEMLMMLPPPFAIIFGSSAAVRKYGPRTLTSKTCS